MSFWDFINPFWKFTESTKSQTDIYRNLEVCFECGMQFLISFWDCLNSIWEMIAHHKAQTEIYRNPQWLFWICNTIYNFVLGLHTFNSDMFRNWKRHNRSLQKSVIWFCVCSSICNLVLGLYEFHSGNNRKSNSANRNL